MNYILFICGHNAGRSQISQALFNTEKKNFPYVDQNYEAISAGTRPGDQLNPTVVEAMKEINIDISDASIFHPKALNDPSILAAGKNLQRAIIACDDSCVLPTGLPKLTLEKLNLPDPHHQPIETVREIRNLVKTKILSLIQELNDAINQN